MASHKVCTPKRPACRQAGFSLIEVLVVLGLLATVGGVTLLVSVRSYSGHSFHAERQLLVVVLQKARSEAMHNECEGTGCTDGLPHGVYITSQSLVLFQGIAYNSNDDTNEEISTDNGSLSITGLQTVTFAQLTGDVAVPGTVTIADSSGRSATVTVGPLGQISWSN